MQRRIKIIFNLNKKVNLFNFFKNILNSLFIFYIILIIVKRKKFNLFVTSKEQLFLRLITLFKLLVSVRIITFNRNIKHVRKTHGVLTLLKSSTKKLAL